MPLSTVHLCQCRFLKITLYIHMGPWIIQMLLQIRQNFSLVSVQFVFFTSSSHFCDNLGRWCTQQQQKVFPKHNRDQHNIKVLNQ